MSEGERLPRPESARYLRVMRRVVKSDKRPLEIKPQAESVWICMCGLSKNQPPCDAPDKTTRGRGRRQDLRIRRRKPSPRDIRSAAAEKHSHASLRNSSSSRRHKG